jgi:WD40 repeat protein
MSKFKSIRTMQGNCGSVPKIAFSPDGRHLASSSGDWKQPIKFWNMTSGEELSALTPSRTDVVTSIAYNRNGHTLASGNWGGVTIKLWDTASGELVGTLPGHNGLVYSLAFSPDGHLLASASRDKTIKLWNLGDAFI